MTPARVVRDCVHPKARHKHGDRNAYFCDKCRCQPCTDAAAKYNRDHNRDKAYGRYDGLVDAEPVRAHIRALGAAGIGLKQITRLGGPSGGVMTKLVYGQPRPDGTLRPPSRRCTRRVAESILSIPVRRSVLAGGVSMENVGTRRRLEALMTLGYSKNELARRLGRSGSNFGRLMSNPGISVATARAVADLYDQCWDTPLVGTDQRSRIVVARSRSYAAAHGYLPPLAWDDIDNPSEQPNLESSEADLDWIAIEEAASGRTVALTKEERQAAFESLYTRGYTPRQIGERLGVHHTTVYQALYRAKKEAA